jgi:hemolysin III
MNFSPGHLARRYSLWELRLDGALHAVGIAAGAVGAVTLLFLAARHGGGLDVLAAGIYSAGLIAMLACSAAYNRWRSGRYAGILQGLDHSAIFLMIAGTYTPFTLAKLGGGWGYGLTILVWSVAAFGILLRILRPRVFERMALAVYLALGWIGLVALQPLMRALDLSTLLLLGAGGLLYTAGVAFHLWTRLPFQNVIWHAFVFAAAGIHFAAVAASI